MTAPTPLIESPLTVRWGDMDAFGHVNNSTYATYIEEARLRWFATIEGGWATEVWAPVVAANTINFRRPITWPEELVIALFLERAGSSSLTLGFRIAARHDAAAAYADGSTVLVWIDRAAGRSVPLPPGVRRAAGLG